KMTVEQIEGYEWNLTSSDGLNQLATLDSRLAKIRMNSVARFSSVSFTKVKNVASAPFGQKR
ncbi:MAG TPA: hypothetical protein VFR55_05890, partial [Dehalococcoidia bacterium]|nr:hypothetical protein [Dehalococcoidia bacterium]